MKVVKENVLTKEINVPIFTPARKRSKEWVKFLKEKMKMKKEIMKRILAGFLAAMLLLVQNPAVYSYEIPTPPPVPENDYVAPTPPPVPENDYVAPTPPPVPTLEEILNPTPTPTPQPEANASNDSSGGDSSSGGGSTDPNPEENTAEASSHDGQTADGQNGDTAIDTGDATNNGLIENDVNNNLSATSAGDGGGGGISVVNDGNGTESDNSGSVKIVDNDTTVQDNDANVVNNLYQDTTTGDNSASRNLGDSEIGTGDANTTGTIVNAVNTNVDGVMVSEFNIADDHLGDIILDFSDSCVSGCGGADVLAKNTGNGADSTNNAEIDTEANDATFQNNDATVENNMTLEADSGNNDANRNTGGDSEIVTGDANVAANIINLVNNNLAGAIVYGVVNIFGTLVGDIILPGGVCCFGGATAVNSGNGADSTNTANIDQTVNNETAQFNNAVIENNLVFDANTGDNDTKKNTNGNSSIESGDASIDGQVINIANTNISGGDWWLVIVNEAGKWIGKILGADGNYYGGSEGFEFVFNEAGEIVVVNSGNGAGSENTGSVSTEVNNTTVQSNTANIVNNVNLDANTGGNSASRNTGGDSSIVTGDANIIANIVNFVNNNITGGGTLYVMVVNVFGSWLGDFVGPGYEKEPEPLAESSGDSGVGGTSSGSTGHNNSSNESGSSQDSGSGDAQTVVAVVNEPTPSPYFQSGALVASAVVEGTGLAFGSDDAIGFATGDSSGSETAGDKIINLNLAWLIALIPAYLVITIVRKRRRLLNLLPLKGK